jgi:preprotein translocase subunit YajC
MSDLAAVLDSIGTMDATELRAVFEAYRNRSKALRATQAIVNKATFKPGDRVVTQGIRPKYLSGLHGTVSAQPARRKGDITILVDENERFGAARYVSQASGVVSVPANCLAPSK